MPPIDEANTPQPKRQAIDDLTLDDLTKAYFRHAISRDVTPLGAAAAAKARAEASTVSIDDSMWRRSRAGWFSL